MQAEAEKLTRSLEVLGRVLREEAEAVGRISARKASLEDRLKWSDEQKSADEERRKDPVELQKDIAIARQRVEEGFARTAAQADRSNSQEAAYMDAFESLMELFTYEDVRPIAREVMALIRQVRAMVLEAHRISVPSMDDLPKIDRLTASEEEKIVFIRNLRDKSREGGDKRLKDSAEILQKQIALLDQALQIATTIGARP